MKNKLYRVYLDRPGCGWEEVVKAANLKAAIKKACKKQGCEDQYSDVLGEVVPDDYLIKQAKIAELKRERGALIDKLTKDYIDGVSAVMDEYKIKIDNV